MKDQEPIVASVAMMASHESVVDDVRGDAAAQESPPSAPADLSSLYRVVWGVLYEDDDLAITQIDDTTLQVAVPGEGPTHLKTYPRKANGKTYLDVSVGPLMKIPAMARRIKGRFNMKRKSIGGHELIAMVANRAILTGTVRCEVGVHHADLNTGSNHHSNLWTLSREVHTRLHREFIDPDKVAYLAKLDAGMCIEDLGMPSDLLDAVEADLDRLEGQEVDRSQRPKDLSASPSEPSYPDDKATSAAPVAGTLKEISLSFDDTRMIVSGTHPFTRPKLNNLGHPEMDEWGQPVHEQIHAPTIVTSDGHLFRLLDRPELPPFIAPFRRFELDDVNGEPRWSWKGMQAFAAGQRPDPELGARLIAAVSAVVRFLRPGHALIVVAYVVMTYLFPLARRVPFLALHSAVPGSGKSTLGEVIWRLAFNAHRMGVSSLAVIPRLTDLARCTLVLDEAEKLSAVRNGADLIELVNSRADAGMTYRVCAPGAGGFKPASYDVYGPLILANMSGVAPTIRSRAITIEMQPMDDDDRRQITLLDQSANWAELRDQLYLFAGANWKSIRTMYETSDKVRVGANRQMDLWRLILAVAAHLGGDEMLEALAQEAAAPVAAIDDLNDAIVLGLIAAIEREGAQDISKPIEVRLGYVHEKACDTLEPDQQRLLSSKKVSAFCRGFGLEVAKSSRFRNTNGIKIPNPGDLRRRLVKQFSHLGL